MSKSHSVARWNLGMEIYNVVDQQRLNMYGILHQEIIKLCVPTSSNTHQRLYVLASSHYDVTVGQCFKGNKATQGELGMPVDKPWPLPKASRVRLDT